MPGHSAPVIPVVLCGGSGSRLWPLSRNHKSKAFIELPSGGTMFGNLLDSLPQLGCAEAVIVVSKEQCPAALSEAAGTGLDCTFIIEPMSKNTAPALSAAMRAIAGKHGNDVVFAMLPSDLHVANRDIFNARIKKAAEGAAGRVVVLGIDPTYPATGFGYIKAGKGNGAIIEVERFIEKPPVSEAKKMLAEGSHYWNTGIFISTVATMAEEFKSCCPELHKAYESLEISKTGSEGVLAIEPKFYEAFPAISIDYAVAEKSDRVFAVVGENPGWSDLGTWADYMSQVPADENGNRVEGDAVLAKTKNSVVHATSGRKVVLAGCDGITVADTPDALLVSSGEASAILREVHAALADSNERCVEFPSFEKRPWGNYRQLGVGPGWQAKRIEVAPKRRLSLQSHKHRHEHWIVVEGIMRITIDGRVSDMKANESCFIPQGAKHRMENPGDSPAVLIEVQCGGYLGEDDIVRYEDDFGRP